MKKFKAFLLALIILPCSFLTFACLEMNPWLGYTEVDSRAELIAAIADDEIDKIKVVDGDFGSETDYENIIVDRPVIIKGAGEEKPTIFGSIVVQLADGETDSVHVENLEISHSGLYVTIEGTRTVDLTKDGRRGILVKNGGVIIKNNYIHLTDETPDEPLYAAPTGIQISVAGSNTVKDQLTYIVEGNRLGVYNQTQHGAISTSVAILCATDANYGEVLNMSTTAANAMFINNTFDEGTDCFVAYFDYVPSEYISGAFANEDSAILMLGEDGYNAAVADDKIEEIDGSLVYTSYLNS